MKKIITAIVSLFSLASIAQADFARIEVGAGAWFQSPDTSMKYENGILNGQDVSKTEQDNSQGYVWVLVKHPIPLIPNLRLEYVNVDSSGIGTGKFEFFDQTLSGDNKSNLELNQYDIIPYYNLLDNTAWITVDVGLDIKVIETSYTIAQPNILDIETSAYEETSSNIFPMLYLRGRFEIPATSIGIESDIKYVTYDESDILDFRVKLDYTLDFIPLVQPAVELGYRVQKMYVVTDEKLVADFDFAGLYVGAMVRF